MKNQGQQIHEVSSITAFHKYNAVMKDKKETSELIILKDWHQKMMPNYEKAEIWLDDSIEPIKWQNTKLERYKQW